MSSRWPPFPRWFPALLVAVAPALLTVPGCDDPGPPVTTARAGGRAALATGGATSGTEPRAALAGAAGLPSSPPAGAGGPQLEGDQPPQPSLARPAASAPNRTDSAPRVYAKSRFVWVWPRPDASSEWIGFLWLGGSAALRDEEPVPGAACPAYYPIEPVGWVCVDDEKATLNSRDPFLEAARPYAPNVASAWPHRYGESLGLQRYRTLPDEVHQRQREGGFRAQMARVERALTGEVAPILEGVNLSPAPSRSIFLPDAPRGMHEPRSRLKYRSTVAWSTETFAHGRSWLLSGDLMWVPKDRVKVYPKVTFQGVELGEDVRLPIAFFREGERPRFRRDETGRWLREPGSYPRLGWVKLTGRTARDGKKTYLETGEGLWVQQADAVVPTLRTTTPWGADVGKPDTTDLAPRGRQTWLEVSVWGGWLVAYEGTRAVYATMVSPGRGGTPVGKRDPLETASTPTGRFKITGKFRTATMEAPNEYIHSDVPWTQNFSGPHALHGAYWHNDWGKLKSAGCINVSPLDGKWLFDFTEPAVPAGWHGVRWRPSAGPATTLIVGR